MAKKPTKPAKPASKGSTKKPAKTAVAAKPKKTAPAKPSKKIAAAKAKPSAKPSSKSAGPKKPALKANPSPNVNKNSSKPAKKAPAAKSPPIAAKNGSTPKKVAPTKPSPAGGKTAPPSKVSKLPSKLTERIPAPRKLSGIEEAPEVVIPKKSPFAAGFLKKQRQRLLDLRSTLLDSMEGVAKDSLRTRPEGSEASVGGMHMGDAGSDAYDRDFALSLLSKEQDALYEINEALKRIDQGSYGICEMTSKPINEERLEALPFARYTREAQESIERDQQGGRNRRVPVRSVFGLDDEESEDDDEEEESGSSSKQNGGTESLDFMKE
jgi:RNA polymerase-binding transcription factor DksA